MHHSTTPRPTGQWALRYLPMIATATQHFTNLVVPYPLTRTSRHELYHDWYTLRPSTCTSRTQIDVEYSTIGRDPCFGTYVRHISLYCTYSSFCERHTLLVVVIGWTRTLLVFIGTRYAYEATLKFFFFLDGPCRIYPRDRTVRFCRRRSFLQSLLADKYELIASHLDNMGIRT